jgi:hypothetical protein
MTTREERLAALGEKRREIRSRWLMYSNGDMRHLEKDAWDELEEVDREIAALSAPVLVPEAPPATRRGEDYIDFALRTAGEQLHRADIMTRVERAAFAAGQFRVVLEIEFTTGEDGKEVARVKIGKGPR